MGDDLVQRGRLVGVGWHDDRNAHLSQHVIGARDHGHLVYARVGSQDGLDLQRVNVVAAPDEHLRDPACQTVAAGRVHRGQVAGPEPSVDEGGGRSRRVAPVSRHGAGCAEPHLSDSADIQHLAVDPPHLGLHAGARPADRVECLVIVRIQRGAKPDSTGLS